MRTLLGLTGNTKNTKLHEGIKSDFLNPIPS